MHQPNTIHIAFRKISSHEQLIALLPDLRELSSDAHLHITVDFDAAVVPSDYLVLLVAYIRTLKASGIACTVDFPDLNPASLPVQYAAQTGFFGQLDITLTGTARKLRSIYQCSEIVPFRDAREVEEACDTLIAAVSDNTGLNPAIIAVLRYSLVELMSHAVAGSGDCAGGFAAVHYAPFQAELRVVVCDAGGAPVQDGGRASAQVADFSGSTSFGRMQDFISANKGELLVHSGSDLLRAGAGRTAVQAAGHWPGTFASMRIRTNMLADYSAVLQEAAPSAFAGARKSPAFAMAEVSGN